MLKLFKSQEPLEHVSPPRAQKNKNSRVKDRNMPHTPALPNAGWGGLVPLRCDPESRGRSIRAPTCSLLQREIHPRYRMIWWADSSIKSGRVACTKPCVSRARPEYTGHWSCRGKRTVQTRTRPLRARCCSRRTLQRRACEHWSWSFTKSRSGRVTTANWDCTELRLVPNWLWFQSCILYLRLVLVPCVKITMVAFNPRTKGTISAWTESSRLRCSHQQQTAQSLPPRTRRTLTPIYYLHSELFTRSHARGTPGCTVFT